MLYTILLNYDTFAYTAVVRLPATAAFLVAYLNWQYILPRKDRPLCDMICVLLQVTAGCWQPCHAWVSLKTFCTEWYLRSRVSRLQMDTLVLSASSSGGLASGPMWLLTTVCQPTMVDWFSCILRRRMSSGALCWKRPMQSLCLSLFCDAINYPVHQRCRWSRVCFLMCLSSVFVSLCVCVCVCLSTQKLKKYWSQIDVT